MERFQFLVKKKIAKQLSKAEARELHALLEEREDCRAIFGAIFARPAADKPVSVKAEEAFALHAEKIQGAN